MTTQEWELISFPDYSFWHRIDYKFHRNRFTDTGDMKALSRMLECIAYEHKDDRWTKDGLKWFNADTWRDNETFGPLRSEVIGDD